MANDEQVAIVCMRVSKDVYVVPGSQYGYHCESCGEEVWVAPSGFDIISEHSSCAIICLDCFVKKEMAKEEEVEIQPLTPRQVLEVKAWLLKD